ncbi:conserved hypothetical protein [Histoplasma capsulatum H143]|uniref:Uncharacterized protein n=1 Tax=Ajellomyces capsulatus (strain H143) TaxID=544712 RepID=C6HDV1_AJECH|nr:conserved hypothetical protein [Histoplasma capsulatum H143]
MHAISGASMFQLALATLPPQQIQYPLRAARFMATTTTCKAFSVSQRTHRPSQQLITNSQTKPLLKTILAGATAAAMQVYYVHDPVLSAINYSAMTSSAEQCLREIYKGHVFRFKDDIFITSEKKPNIPAVQNMTLEYSCADESFLYAAAAGQNISSAIKVAYMNIIKKRGLEKKFEEICENRDMKAKKYLNALTHAWSNLLEVFDQVHRRLVRKIEQRNPTKWEQDLACLRSFMIGAMEDALEKIWEIPEHTADILYSTRSNSLSDCDKRMDTISWSFCMTKSLCDLPSLADLLLAVKDQFRQDLVKLTTHDTESQRSRDLETWESDLIPPTNDVAMHWYSAEAEKVKQSNRIHYVGEERLEDGRCVRSLLMLPDNVKLRLQYQKKKQLRAQQKEQQDKRLRTLRSYRSKAP